MTNYEQAQRRKSLGYEILYVMTDWRLHTISDLEAVEKIMDLVERHHGIKGDEG